MRYRRVALVFAVFVLHGTSAKVCTAAHDSIDIMEEFVEIDGEKISRRGVINELAVALEGVVDVTDDILSVILSPLKKLIKLDQYAITHNPHQKDVATIRLGSPVCEDELAFRSARLPIVKAAQERFLGMELEDDEVLEIGFSGSGGGVRAKTYSLGACVGASRIGLLDTVMYMSGLSGSTWFLGPWISSGWDVETYRQRALEDCVQGMNINDVREVGPILDAMLVKFAYDQQLNIIDGYGALLGNSFLRDYGKAQNLIYLSDQAKIIASGAFPLPIYTALLAERDTPDYWFEFTPYEVGSRWLGAYVPTWAFGQRFKNGTSRESAPEMSLGFHLGIFGSAFAASFEEAYDVALENAQVPGFLKGVPYADKIWAAIKRTVAQLVHHTDAGELRLAWAEVFNYVYKMKQVPFHEYKDLKLADCGVYFNNPIPALYRKPPYGDAPDVIFVFDSGATIEMKDLQLAADYLKKNNMAFPTLNPQADIAHSALTVFGDVDDLSVPLVIYMPRILDHGLLQRSLHDAALAGLAEEIKEFDIEAAVESGFASTFSFDYTIEQANMIADVGELNVRACGDQIRELLQRRVEAKRATKTYRTFKHKEVHVTR
jgi:hypothetical protein